MGTISEPAMLAVLLTLLAIASAWDVALHRIPNSLVAGVAVTGLFAAILNGGAAALGLSMLAVAGTAGALWPAWTRSWIGGGDLKLGAATAAWLSIVRVPVYLLASAVALGAVSIVCYAVSERASREEVRRNLACAARGIAIDAPIAAQDGRVQVPAGAAFAVAAIVVLAMTGGV